MVNLCSKTSNDLATHSAIAGLCEYESQERLSKGGENMTANQIRYAEHIESKRHNRETEGIQSRSADASMYAAQARMAQAGASYASVAEAQRHNSEQEAIGWADYYSMAKLRSDQGRATLYDAETRRMGVTTTDEHYRRADAAAGVNALNGSVNAGANVIGQVGRSVSGIYGGK